MVKNLLIVESPAKAKTIEKYLGKDFTVKSSYGHVRDLAKSKMGVDVDNGYQPKYVVSDDKKKVVKDLQDWVKKAEEVWLATDEDREGEAISWHLCQVLGLDEQSTKRIVFREITQAALQKAIQSPRSVDIDLVNAQQARRVLDRLVGFELSGLLWRKVKGKLSAGRVQSVAVKLIVERERQIQQFETKPFFRVVAVFSVKNVTGNMVDVKAELNHRFNTESEAETFLEDCKQAVYKITRVQVKPTKRKPSAPFTTSTLQQEASRKLGFSVKRTMMAAQKLYEAGHISYMRTDSVSLSQQAMGQIGDAIVGEYGERYHEARVYKSKGKNAQEAHEAIRPTQFKLKQAGIDTDQTRVYELIWKRTVASQMAQAELERTTVDISISSVSDLKLVAKGEVLKFDGFLKLYLESTDEEDEMEEAGMLPPMQENQELGLKEIVSTERFTRPPARFTEASLVKKMEELGIGRPSTYAPTISKITEINRGYILKDPREGKERAYGVMTLNQAGELKKETRTEITGAEKNKLFPSDLGMLVCDFLDEHFTKIMDYQFTANIEAKFDKIASGDEDWEKMIDGFYSKFHETVERTLEEAERVTGERILGKDPESGRTILVRMSKFGPVAQIGIAEELAEDEKPRYANLKPTQSLATINIEDSLDLFQFPKDLGEYESKMVTIGSGRYGPYVKYDEKFISIPKGEDPLQLSYERAVELVEEKKKADAPIGTHEGLPFTKGKGRFGPFLKWNGLYVNIPRRFDPETITVEESIELIKIKQEKEANRYIHQWEDEKISVQNGRWGPFIKYKKKNVKLPKNDDGTRKTAEDVKDYTLEDVKKLIEVDFPDAFKKKTRAKKKPAAKKTTKKK